jgi:mRNA interferase MazF
MELKRGDVVLVRAPGSYGKPGPGVVVQSNYFKDTGSLTVLLMTSYLHDGLPLVRHRIMPSSVNGLLSVSEVMIDKLFTIPRERLRQKIGHLSSTEMVEITASLALFLGM